MLKQTTLKHIGVDKMSNDERIRDFMMVFQDFKDKPDDQTFKATLDELVKNVIYLLGQLPEDNSE